MDILFVCKGVVVFEIDEELWYLHDKEGIPKLYNSGLNEQIVPNIDHWFQAKTKQRYSYQSVCDMAKAFKAGMDKSYNVNDIVSLCIKSCVETVRLIFRGGFADEYYKHYRVELIHNIDVRSIRDNFDDLLHKIGKDSLYLYLCRLWHLCHVRELEDVAVFERLIRRLDMEPSIPEYPDTSDIDVRLAQKVVAHLIGDHIQENKEVPPEVARGIDVVRSS